ncbi:MAG: hypothetical protein H6Q67_582 [Firmicutes bacterium]|nr:hypothetical protein [Bacillota bacterium]
MPIKFTSRKLLYAALNVWSALGIILLLSGSLYYMLCNVFLDHAGEVTIASVAWLLYDGHPLYTTIDATERYSIQHGPMSYLLIGGVMRLLGPSFQTIKLPSVIALVIILFVSWYWFSRLLDKKTSIWLLGLEAWLFLKYYYLYLARDDVFMVLCTLTAMYFATAGKNKIISILGMAIMLGILVNFKIHGILYALPILALVIQRYSTKEMLMVLGGLVCVGLLPFLLPNISLVNYILWLRLSVSHGISLKILLGNLSMVVFLCLIPLSIGWYYRCDLRAIFHQNKLFLLSLGISVLLVAIIGGKCGSGSYHLAPFIPIILYLLICFILYIRQSSVNIPLWSEQKVLTSASLLLAILFIVISVNAIHGQGRIIRYITHNRINQAMLHDMRAIESKYQGNSMMIGYGDLTSYRYYDELIPLLVFDGNPYLLDVSALNDMNASGVPIPAATIHELAKGTVKLWLIPAGNIPFSLADGYRGSPLFDETFRQTFLAHYVVIEHTKYFDVWAYKP